MEPPPPRNVVFILGICSVSSSGLEKKGMKNKGSKEEEENRRAERKGGGCECPNLWCRGGRAGGVAALLVSAEHKLP